MISLHNLVKMIFLILIMILPITKTQMAESFCVQIPLGLKSHLTCSTPCGDLTGQPLEIFWKISIFISIGDDLNPFVQHVFSKLLELIHISSPNQHEMF